MTGQNQESKIQKLTEEEVTEEAMVFDWLDRGETVRKVAATNYNQGSSRSHTVFKIKLIMKAPTTKGRISVKTSEINLVDLAGSEGVNAHNKNALRFRECSNINKSLLALSNVIQELGNKKTGFKYISYRHSKLTRILQNSLSGNSKTSIICTINQTYHNRLETLSTLKFGEKAKNIKTKLNVNQSFNKTSSNTEK